MIRILKNKTSDDANVAYANVTVIIEAGNQRDLAETFEAWQLAAIDELVVLLGQGTDKFQLNDGVSDLGVAAAIDLVRGYSGASKPVVLTSSSGENVSVEPDGRLVVVNFPADEGTFMWLAGAGDDIENQVRGGGTDISVEFADVTRAEPEVKTIDLNFMEWIQLHDGQVTVTDNAQWSIGDKWQWGVVMTATAVTPNATNEGNCNVVNPAGQPGQPDSYIIVPAMGDGAFDVDLSTAVPVPARGAGYWSYDWRTDTLVPSANPGSADYYLLAVDAPMAYFMRAVTVPIHKAGNFDFDAYKAERIYSRWTLRLIISKKSNGPGKMSGWLVCFREFNT